MPPQIQRMQSEDLVALIFPDQLACLENIAGEREVPDHPLVRQTIEDCLYDAMDLDRLSTIVGDIKNKKLGLHAVNLREPSPLAHEIITSKPYTFIDDTPFEERRTLAINQRRWIDPGEAKELGKLDQEAIKLVREEAWMQAETTHELHDGLLLAGFVLEDEVTGNHSHWHGLMEQLVAEGRAFKMVVHQNHYWIAIERASSFKVIHTTHFPEDVVIPPKLDLKLTLEKALLEIIRGRLETLGPTTAERFSGQHASYYSSSKSRLIGPGTGRVRFSRELP